MRALRVTLAIAGKDAVADHDTTARTRATQDSIFIVPKPTPLDREVLTHCTDASAVLARRPRVRKRDIANRNVGTVHYENRLVLANSVTDDHVALALDHEVIG